MVTHGKDESHIDNIFISNFLLAVAALVLAQLSFSGFHVVASICLTKDVNPFIFALYRESFASVLMLVLYVAMAKEDLGGVKAALASVKDAMFGSDRYIYLLLGFSSYVNIMGSTVALTMTAPSLFAIFQVAATNWALLDTSECTH